MKHGGISKAAEMKQRGKKWRQNEKRRMAIAINMAYRVKSKTSAS